MYNIIIRVIRFVLMKGAFAMKKIYQAPQVNTLPYCAQEAIAEDPNSFPYNDGELGWT